MDPRTSAQDVIRCYLCDKEIAMKYCDFCHVNLCISCIGKHIYDDYDKHKVVPIEHRKSTLIYPKCANHQTKTCEFHCKECNTSVCSLCTTMSDKHKRHSVTTLFDLYSSKRDVIAKDTEEIENIISPTYEEITSELENEIANLDEKYEKLVKAVSNQGEEWHREIKSIVYKMIADIENIKLKHKSILKEHLDEIKSIQSLIEQTQSELRGIEESNKVSKTTEYNSQIKELSKLPPKFQVSLPTFSPNAIDKEQLYKLFGSLSPLSTTKDGNGYRLKKSEAFKKELLKEPILITSINTGHKNLLSVTCHNEEEIWTSVNDTRDMNCFNIKGSLIKTIKPKSYLSFRDIVVNSDGNLVYADFDGTANTVNEIMNGQTEELIRLQGWIPVNLCFTSSGDVLVVMINDKKTNSKVVRYSGSTEKQTIQFDDEGKPLYSGKHKIKYIRENKNRDICVADFEAHAVVVVNQTGKLRFRYIGHPSFKKDKPFQPIGITSDTQSHILTADSDNHCIHILDQDGQFLRFIENCDLKDPYGLYVDENDNLFVTEFYSGKVKKIQYLK